MSTTFAVSHVTPVVSTLETMPVEAAIHRLTSRETVKYDEGNPRPPVWPCEAIGCRQSHLIGALYHPLVAAVGQAFHEHRPLRLSPDHIWLVIEQGFALHIQENSERLRARFVQHAGRERITVRRDDFVPGQANPWSEMIDALRGKIRERIGKKEELFALHFSTSTPISKTAFSVVLLGAMKGYFDYEFLSLCGIPSITLDGTTADWRSIRQHVEGLREFDLDNWIDALLPILDHFVEASQGKVDQGFWRDIYKLNEASGGPYITGWIQLFFPYIGSPSKPLRRSEFHQEWRAHMTADFDGGPTAPELPPGLSAVPFKWQFLTQSFEMELLGGFVGIEQNSAGALSPCIGWAVRQTE